MDADQIIVLEDGEISGVGTHAELLVNNSWYKKAVEEL
jgi:ABC-type multidrug transport system fused ATPase/permease subunit